MQTIRIGGVPEHFNMPWQFALQNQLFQEEGIDLQWTDYPTGTGAMAKDLRANVLDVAVLLTEGIVADITKGNPSQIVQFYVKSPLVWGIHVAANSGIEDVSQLDGKKYAISRMGSGSHLMAFVDADQRGFGLKQEQLVIVNNLDGAVKALSEGEADIFMWEKFMTKPLVDKGIFRRIGECPTPWSCFVIAVRNEFLAEHKESLKKMLDVINGITATFKENQDIVSMIANQYHLQETDVTDWLKTVTWASDSQINAAEIDIVTETLLKLGITDKKLAFEELVKYV
jgi:ABC-type nitrate/sulfonate/bicarbonate transport system substrate-binding protein